jgi:subtilase family serine protease
MKNWGRALVAFAGSLAVASCSGMGSAPSSGVVPSGPQPNRVTVSHPMRSTGWKQPGVKALCPEVQAGFARCFALVRTDMHFTHAPAYRRVTGVAKSDLAKAAASGYFGPLGPPQIQQAYNLPSASAGKGQTVAIVDAYDDPTALSDVAQYRKTFGLPTMTTPCSKTAAMPCISKVNQQGMPSPLPSPNAGWAGEISLDLDMVSATCPNCNIVLVEGTTSSFKNLGTAAQTAAKLGANVISNSYGGGECSTTSSGKVVCSNPSKIAHYYKASSAVVVASTGDSSWFAGPQSPADFGNVVAAGGTSMYPFAGLSRGWLETAWTDAGSGCSLYIKNPSWIPSTGCPNGKRAGGDVSFDADPYTGVLVYETYPGSVGGFFVYGGTSVASPAIAGMYALAGNASTLNMKANGVLYSAMGRSNLTPTTLGKNGIPGLLNVASQICGIPGTKYPESPLAVCVAGSGGQWNGPTGNGTPWGIAAL